MPLERHNSHVIHPLPPEAIRVLGDISTTKDWVVVSYTKDDEWSIHSFKHSNAVEEFLVDYVEEPEGWSIWGLYYDGKPVEYTYSISVDLSAVSTNCPKCSNDKNRSDAMCLSCTMGAE